MINLSKCHSVVHSVMDSVPGSTFDFRLEHHCKRVLRILHDAGVGVFDQCDVLDVCNRRKNLALY